MNVKIPSYSGKSVSLLTPQVGELCLPDMVLSLARFPRFNGQTCGRINQIYSQAQHAVLVSYLVPEKYAFAGLLHNLHLAHIGGVIAPVEGLMGDPYAGLKNIHQAEVHRFFSLSWPLTLPMRAAIEQAQRQALRIESQKVLNVKEDTIQQFVRSNSGAGYDAQNDGNQNEYSAELSSHDLTKHCPIAVEPKLPSTGYALYVDRFNQLCSAGQELGFTRHV